jgi:hypothetical protein
LAVAKARARAAWHATSGRAPVSIQIGELIASNESNAQRNQHEVQES